MTLGLEGRCSIQLSYGQKFLPADKPKFWSGWRDSNPVGQAKFLVVRVAQLVESRIVIPVVVGSSPISYPT